MKVLVVYLGQAALGNFAHSTQTGVWGFKPNMQAEGTFGPGDILLFASGYTGNIRLPEEQWLPHHVTMVATAQIETPLSSSNETTFHWPDEISANKVLYPKRFKFSDLKRQDGRFPLNDPAFFPREISLAIRKTGIGGKGQIVEINALPAWLKNAGPIPQAQTPPPPTTTSRPNPPAPAKKRSVPDTLFEIGNFIASRGFVFSGGVLRAFYASLRSKPFVILAGNSGTGKSRLVRLFAEASGANVDNGRFTMIAVRPDWNDSSELLGYFDLNGDFIPGQLMTPFLMAHRDPTKPFFVCLDEMNLAKVEHYFSEFLSIAESRRRLGGQIVTDPILREGQLAKMKPDALRTEATDALKQLRSPARPLGLPENLYIFGTVNMDETTQPFSRKVLDRAHTIEFNNIDLLQGVEEEAAASEVPALLLEQSFFAARITCLTDALPEHRETARKIAEFITDLNAVLAPAGFEVGYRVRDEAVSFAIFAEEAGLTPDAIREAIVLQKILPRIQGSSPRVERLLIALLNKLKGEATVPQIDDPGFDDQLSALRSDPSSSAVLQKVAGMLQIFRDENFTSFWLA